MNMRQKGMLYMIASVFVFTVVNALIKECAANYHINQIVFFRFFFALIPTALILYWKNGWRGFKYEYPLFQTVRAMFGTLGLGCMFYSFGHMPVFADAIAISFSTTLFAVLVAYPLLKERPSPRHIMAVLAGFLGILFIAKPSGNVFNTAALLGIIGAAVDSVTLTTGRLLTNRGTSPAAISFHYGVIASLLGAVSFLLPTYLPESWATSLASIDIYPYMPPSWKDFCLLALMGIGGGLGQYLMAEGFAHAPAAVASPMIYTAMIWSVLISLLLGEIPGIASVSGMVLIVISGLYIAYLENQHRKHMQVTAA